MSLLRMAIRKQAIKFLKGRTNAGSNVRANRSETNWQENLPGINVYTRGEVNTEMNQAPRRLRRNLELEVEIIDEGSDGEEISDKLDILAEQVERCLSVDDSLGGCADDIILTNVSDLEVESGGSKPSGSIRLTFNVKYNEFSPRDRKGQGTFETFEELSAEWDLQPGQDEADRATDIITIPTP